MSGLLMAAAHAFDFVVDDVVRIFAEIGTRVSRRTLRDVGEIGADVRWLVFPVPEDVSCHLAKIAP